MPWFQRDFSAFALSESRLGHPIKIFKGPRQVGKTSLLERLEGYELVLFDDLHIRRRAQDNPGEFLDSLQGPSILDEATLAPNLFHELKLRLDKQRCLATREGTLKTCAAQLRHGHGHNCIRVHDHREERTQQ